MPETPPSRCKPNNSLPDTLQSRLELNSNELAVLLRLVVWERLAKEQVCAIAVRGHQPIRLSSVPALIRELRRKLAAHKIKLETIRDFGWGLDQRDRDKIVGWIGPRQIIPEREERRPRPQRKAAGAKISGRLGYEPRKTMARSVTA